MLRLPRFLLIISLMSIALTTALAPTIPVLADSTENSSIGDVTDPGILPDSGFYFLKSWGRNLQLMFAASDIEKAQLMMKYTNEDALALKKLCDAGKCDIAAKYTEQYEAQLRNTVQNMEQLRSQHGKEASAGLVEKLEQNYLQQQQVLAQVLENAPEPAQNDILNAIENTNRHMEQLVLAHKGEAALEQYQEQISQQTENMGENTKLKIQQRLQASHGQTQNQSDAEPAQTDTMQQTSQQTMQQMTQQTGQQSVQQNSQNQGTQQLNPNGSNMSDPNDNGNKKHGK